MQPVIDKFKNIKPRSVYQNGISFIEHHSLTVLIIVAGILIGFSLFSVSSFTQNASKTLNQSPGDTPAPLTSLGIKPETEETLIALSQDEDVSISSNIASYRRSAFSSATNESNWVVDAAAALEAYYVENEFYPTENQIVSVLGQAGVEATDSEGRAVNASGSSYRYTPERCENGRCGAFYLTADVGTSIYQLGETDSTKRDWVNNTAQALDTFFKASSERLYPTENDFIADMNKYYLETLNSTFVAADPSGFSVNDEESDYSYRGIDCTPDGCRAFVLRTTFKDGALYFQQSR